MVSLRNAIKTIKQKGSGIHQIKEGYYAFGEAWDYECVNDACGHLDDEEEFDACAREHAYNVTQKDIPQEINKKGYKILDIDLVDEFEDVPYGYSIALLEKDEVSR